MKNLKPKILIVGTTDNKGGAASVGWTIGESLRKKGYWVKYIVGYKFSDSKHVYELKKPFLTKILDKYLPIKTTPLFRYLRSFLFANDIDFGSTNEIIDHPWFKKTDVIHFHNLHGSYFKLENLTKMSSKKLVWTLHDMWALSGNCVYSEDPSVWKNGIRTKTRIMEYPPMLWNNTHYLWNKKRKIYKKIKNKLNVVFPSNWLSKKAEESILKDHQSFTIHNGIDEKIFKPGKKNLLRQKLNLPPDKKIITFVAQGGSYDKRKGWKYIEKIANRYKDDDSILFLSIGGGESERKENIIFIPNIGKPELLAEYYSASDLFLFTSLAENCPLVVLESMACGLPVISFDVGGVKELVEHKKTGYIVKYKDEQDLEKGLEWFLNLNNKELKQLSDYTRKIFLNKFTIDKMVDKYLEIYTQ